MTRLLLTFLLLGLAGCVSRPPRISPPAPIAAEVEVVRSGSVWTADFRFMRASPAWVFVRSSVARADERSWRAQSWTVETPGVRLERRGRYDLLVADDGGPVPEHVRIGFTPFTGELATDPAPALTFTNGAAALYSEQFDAFGLPGPGEADRLPADLSGPQVPYTRTRVTFRDEAGPLLYAGRRVASIGLDDDEGTYVLFGAADPVVRGGIVTVIDPELPQWIRGLLERATPDILARYSAALGPPPGVQPMLMVSWAGPRPRLTSMTGSVLPDLLVMTFEGAGVLRENQRLRERALWFIAHETAHFWLGEAVVYQYSRDAWITEGGAELLAIRTVAEVDPAYDWRAELQTLIDDCVRLSAGRGVASAEDRGEHRAYYACGTVFGLVAEAASRRPFSAFVRRLVDANRADRVVTRAEWLARLDRVSRDPSLSADIERMLDQGSENPSALIASLFERAGVRHALADDGRPRLL